MKRKRISKEERRKKTGERLVAAGFLSVMIFGMALDGPDNHMPTICAGIIAGVVMMLIGAGQAGLFREGSDINETQEPEETYTGTEEAYGCYRS